MRKDRKGQVAEKKTECALHMPKTVREHKAKRDEGQQKAQPAPQAGC